MMNQHPTLPEIQAALTNNTNGDTNGDANGVTNGGTGDSVMVVVLSRRRGQRLASALGWLPTPTLAEMSDENDNLCCPVCGAPPQALCHERRGPIEVHNLIGVTSDGDLLVDYDNPQLHDFVDIGWLRCRQCDTRFHMPDELHICWEQP